MIEYNEVTTYTTYSNNRYCVTVTHIGTYEAATAHHRSALEARELAMCLLETQIELARRRNKRRAARLFKKIQGVI